VRIREAWPGVSRLEHDPDRHDDRVIALALAASHVLERTRSATPGRIFSPARTQIPPMYGIPGGVGARPSVATAHDLAELLGVNVWENGS
jgi:hypothetical protein